MNKLRSIRIKAFRGARFEQIIDFGKDSKSLAVFGQNASGKSTITDAVEWFFTGQIRHLWAEDCKAEAIRNIHEESDSDVEIRFDDGALNSTRTLKPSLKVDYSNNSADFTSYLESAAKERIVLRHADVANFVVSTKNKKREEIEKIIGYEEVKKFRDVIRSTRAKLEADSEYQAAIRIVEQRSAELLQLTGETINQKAQVVKFFNAQLAVQGVKTAVIDGDSYKAALSELKLLIGDHTRAEKKVKYLNFKKEVEKLQSQFEKLDKDKLVFEKAYSELILDEVAIKRIRMETFLSSGLSMISEEGGVADDECPFCLSEYDLNLLKVEVEQRVSEISKLSKLHREVTEKKNALCATIADVQRQTNLIDREYKDLITAVFASPVEFKIEPVISQELVSLNSKFASFLPIEFTGAGFSAASKLSSCISPVLTGIDEQANKLSFSAKENERIETLSRCHSVAQAFKQRTKNKRIVDLFRRQISTLSEIYEGFIVAQNKAVQEVLDAISGDVDKFYAALHPSSFVDGVRLRILGEQGIEFGYSFHGKPTYPPRKYLSESFLNSLGIVLFLASAKLFNEKCRFLVLDDIVTSFDQSLRRRLIRLINSEFADWQILLLTHEEFWFELMKREFPRSSWTFKEVRFDVSNGTSFDESPNTLEELISVKRAAHDVSNDLRKLLELTLKQICASLEVKVAFRYNDQNEHRMPDELLSALQGTVTKHKCAEIVDAAVFANLKGSALVVNRGSHDSSDQINSGDIDVALEDISSFKSLFFCNACNRYVSSKSLVTGEKKISCGCGAKKLTWH